MPSLAKTCDNLRIKESKKLVDIWNFACGDHASGQWKRVIFFPVPDCGLAEWKWAAGSLRKWKIFSLTAILRL